ncbi:capsid cement protein [Roseisolibacter agri]|uniref:Uncharacterized protein n=1 Tax=Roseisolibacter agri TaxID=2014610 RepID=A0AA37Q9Z2_9BACT|nr:capsid cement protein [Roseisolibacter agri]GLC25071.1 hypothetical protein rosag_15840 [Roseisolibacter agri]
MPNRKLISVSQMPPVLGYENESATTLSEGMAAVAGSAEGLCTVGAADAEVLGIVAKGTEATTGQVASLHVGHGQLVYVRSGAAFAVGAPLTIDNAGRFVTATSTKKIQAKALGAAAAANELIAAVRMDGQSVVA